MTILRLLFNVHSSNALSAQSVRMSTGRAALTANRASEVFGGCSQTLSVIGIREVNHDIVPIEVAPLCHMYIFVLSVRSFTPSTQAAARIA